MTRPVKINHVSAKRSSNFLNQVHWPARAWFLKIVFVRMSVCVFVCVSPPPRLLITSGVMWLDMDPMQSVKKSYTAVIWQL